MSLGHQRWVWDCVFSVDGAFLITGIRSYIIISLGFAFPISYAISFLPHMFSDFNWIFRWHTASSDSTARLWTMATGEAIRVYQGHHKATVCCALHDGSTESSPSWSSCCCVYMVFFFEWLVHQCFTWVAFCHRMQLSLNHRHALKVKKISIWIGFAPSLVHQSFEWPLFLTYQIASNC